MAKACNADDGVSFSFKVVGGAIARGLDSPRSESKPFRCILFHVQDRNPCHIQDRNPCLLAEPSDSI